MRWFAEERALRILQGHVPLNMLKGLFSGE